MLNQSQGESTAKLDYSLCLCWKNEPVIHPGPRMPKSMSLGVARHIQSRLYSLGCSPEFTCLFFLPPPTWSDVDFSPLVYIHISIDIIYIYIHPSLYNNYLFDIYIYRYPLSFWSHSIYFPFNAFRYFTAICKKHVATGGACRRPVFFLMVQQMFNRSLW